jgi:hypothetical protein
MVLAESLMAFNNSKIVWATTMMLFNLGSKHVMGDVSPSQERILAHSATKHVVLFCMFFVATHDITTSVIMTFAFVVFFRVLFHEQSRFCILPERLVRIPETEPKNEREETAETKVKKEEKKEKDEKEEEEKRGEESEKKEGYTNAIDQCVSKIAPPAFKGRYKYRYNDTFDAFDPYLAFVASPAVISTTSA